MQWAQKQVVYSSLLLTTHSNFCNQLMRNHFRVRFAVDCVLFHPDQYNPTYTQPDDVWMAVSDFAPSGELQQEDFSSRLVGVHLTLIVAEEFAAPDPQVQIMLDSLIGPVGHLPSNAVVLPRVLDAYRHRSQEYIGI